MIRIIKDEKIVCRIVKIFVCLFFLFFIVLSQASIGLGGTFFERRLGKINIQNKDMTTIIDEMDLENVCLETLPDGNVVNFSISLKNPTVTEFLNELINKDKRYTWRIIDGVVNILPLDLINEKQYLLNVKIPSFQVKDATVFGIEGQLYKIAPSYFAYIIHASTGSFARRLKRLSLTLSDKTVREILNQLIVKKLIKRWIAYNEKGKYGRVAVLTRLEYSHLLKPLGVYK